MIRFLNLLAIIALIASASAAYSVKYETILVAEKLRKREAELVRERDAISVLQAEWQLLNRPVRLQAYFTPDLGLQPVSVRQIARVADVPLARPESDAIDGLLTGSLATPDMTRKSGGRMPVVASTIGTKANETGRLTSARKVAAASASAPNRAAIKASAMRGAEPRAQASARPMALVPPASIPNTGGREAGSSGGISSLLGKLLGQ